MLTLSIACGGDDPAAPQGNGGGGTQPLSFDNFQAAALAIGQPDLGSGTPNAGGGVGPAGLSAPFGAPGYQSGGRLYVPDQLNHRILIFNTFPATSGAAANFVLGQPDLTTNTSGTSATAFSAQITCVVSAGKLFAAEFGNRRVLIWNTIPTATNVPADVVVGQPDFTTSIAATSITGLQRPYDIAVSNGRLFVVDGSSHRVMIWNTIPTTNGAPADVVVGQSDFTSNTNGLTVTALTLPTGIWVGNTRMAIADRNNGRVLLYNSIPTTNGAPADLVLGAPDFTTQGGGTPSSTRFCPYDVASDGANVFVSDESANRVMIFPFPTTNGQAATGVLGQTNFTLTASNDSNQDGTTDVVSARVMSQPTGLVVIGQRLLVTDQFNHRVLVFESK